MLKAIVSVALLVACLGCPAFADPPLAEGRSVSCSNDKLVCAVLKNGTSMPTSECQARADGAIRILPGDCYDED